MGENRILRVCTPCSAGQDHSLGSLILHSAHFIYLVLACAFLFALFARCPDFATLPLLLFISTGYLHFFNSLRFPILFARVMVAPCSPVHYHLQLQRVGSLILLLCSKVGSFGSSFSISHFGANVRFSRPRKCMWIK